MAVAVSTNVARAVLEPLSAESGSEPDDATLVFEALADGCRFALLYRRYVDRIYRYCYRRLGSREAAEDATSVVFARALAALASCRPESFRSWLFTIAHNVIASDLRDRGRRPIASLDPDFDLISSELGPEAAALAAEERASVQAVLVQLPDDQRRVLELRLAGLNGPEIAGVLARSPGSVRLTQFRAITRLRQLLDITGKENGNGE